MIKPGEQSPSKVEEQAEGGQQALKDWWLKGSTDERDGGSHFTCNVCADSGLNDKMLDHWAHHKTHQLSTVALAQLEKGKASYEKQWPTNEGAAHEADARAIRFEYALKQWWIRNSDDDHFTSSIRKETGLDLQKLDSWANAGAKLAPRELADVADAQDKHRSTWPINEGKIPDALKKHQFKADEGKMPDHVVDHFKKKRGVKEGEDLPVEEMALLEAAYQAIGESVLEAQTIAEGEIPAALKKHQFKKEKAGKAKESIKEAIASGVVEGLNFGGPSDTTIREYPSIEDYMEGDDAKIKAALASGPPTELVVKDWFEDDHEDCALVVIKIGGVELKTSFWWLSRSGSNLLSKAEEGKASALKTVYTSLIKPLVEEYS